jgi:hypothetical protein
MRFGYLLCSILMLAFQPLLARGQETRPSYLKTITVNNIPADSIYSTALTFSKDVDQFILTGGKINNPEKAKLRGKWAFSWKLIPGYESTDAAKRTIKARCLWIYQVGNMGCIQMLSVSGDVTITCKDGQSTISITPLKYVHTNAQSPPFSPYIDGDGICKPSGTIEDLMKCKACPKAIAYLMRFIESSATKLMDEYGAYLSTSKP